MPPSPGHDDAPESERDRLLRMACQATARSERFMAEAQAKRARFIGSPSVRRFASPGIWQIENCTNQIPQAKIAQQPQATHEGGTESQVCEWATAQQSFKRAGHCSMLLVAGRSVHDSHGAEALNPKHCGTLEVVGPKL